MLSNQNCCQQILAVFRASLFLLITFGTPVYSATSVTIYDEAYRKSITGIAAAASLDDAWGSSLPYGAFRPDLFNTTGAGLPHAGTKNFTDSIANPYQVDWQVGYINTTGPGIPTSIVFIPVNTGSVTLNTSDDIQSSAPNPYTFEYRLSTGFSAPGLNAIRLDFSNSSTSINEFGIYVGDLESRLNNGTAGRVIVYNTSGALLSDTPIQYTGTVLNGVDYDSADPLGAPTGAAANPSGSWGNSTTSFIAVKSDDAIGRVIIHVGDDDHTTNNNGASEGLGIAGFQIPDQSIIVVPLNPTLTLIKTVVNDNGGSAIATDFTPSIDSIATSWNTAVTLSAGPHIASESSLAGYTAGSWGGDCAADGRITLVLGQNATCTITNDDIPQSADLSVTKTLVTSGPYTSGQTVNYTITVSNAGPDTATNVVVTDLPTNLIITSATGPSSSCAISPTSGLTTSVDCTIASLLNGDSETITLQATVP
ncbi:hypothetical protein [uncultured Cocleimonas sp.]|uniref:hypothetical protein n=1 Tax=uncultured Cocleimonas sp. TaxID=1051587 RepID=UPI00261F68FA|nr:hypothetical protein [uncultured Cocleimonas sp.]